MTRVIKNRIVRRGPFNSITRNNFANQVLHDINYLSNKFSAQEMEIVNNLETSLQDVESLSNKIRSMEDIISSIISNL